MTSPKTSAPSGQESRQILDERARRLALPVDAEPGERLSLLTFWVQDRRCGVEVRCVREVLPHAEITLLPWSEPSVAGLMSVHGELLVVFDLVAMLGMTGTTPAGPVIVLGDDGRSLGLRVDRLGEVTSIDPAEIAAPPPGTEGRASGLVRGATPSGIVLDADALLATIHTTKAEEQ